jgi:cobalt-zinc-cadmium efflux system membrane fusion protein
VPGKIITLFARAGDDVDHSTPLYTIDSADLVQAGQSLIATAGVLNLTTRVLERAKQLYTMQGISQKDLDQVISDQQAAEGAFTATQDAVRIFGKTDPDMDRIVAEVGAARIPSPGSEGVGPPGVSQPASSRRRDDLDRQ